MADTSARMLRLLSFLQSKRDWSGAELSERLDVSVRTTRRDIETLRELGYPVNVTRGPGGAYRFGAGAALPPLILDDEQAVAVTALRPPCSASTRPPHGPWRRSAKSFPRDCATRSTRCRSRSSPTPGN